jgi:hypothetical protein
MILTHIASLYLNLKKGDNIMKRSVRVVFILVIALLICTLAISVSHAADDRNVPTISNGSFDIPAAPVTREQFFVDLAKWLELSPESSCTVEFPDINDVSPENLNYIYSLVNNKYVLGRTNGLLDPKTMITEKEMKLVFDRIELMREQEPEIVTKIQYVDGGTTYVEVPVEVPVPMFTTTYVPTRMHGYIYDETRGFYYCPHCDDIKPPGTAVYTPCNTTGAAITTTAGLYYDDSIILDIMDGHIDTYNDISPLSGMMYSYIGYDADCYIINGEGELESIEFIEMIKLYTTTGFQQIYFDVVDVMVDGTDTNPLLLNIVVIDP